MHIHWVIWAANGKTDSGFSEVTYIDVVADDSDSALDKAKKYIPNRKFYWINNVIEHLDNECHSHGE
jgi:hypothetical protein